MSADILYKIVKKAARFLIAIRNRKLVSNCRESGSENWPIE